MVSSLFRLKYDEYGNTREIVVYADGQSAQATNYINKGTAFTSAERELLELEGSLPPGHRTLEQQLAGSRMKVAQKQSDLEKYIFIRALFGRNVTLAHALIASDITSWIKIIYTPTVGIAVQNYSSMFRQAHGLHLHPGNINRAEDLLRRFGHRDIRLAVVTDNQGVLGLGDQGAGGIAVCLGKLMIYTQGAGIAPWHCLPVTLDVGTDNEELLADQQYLGWRQPRLEGEAYLSFIGRFVRAFRSVFPSAVCQWEDFSTPNAISIQNAFCDELLSFNDDLRGSGAVALANILSAMKVKKEKLIDQKFLIHGGGPSAIGIADQLRRALMQAGLKDKEACELIFIIGKQEMLVKNQGVPYYKAPYAKSLKKYPWMKDVSFNDGAKVVAQAGITTLIATSGQNYFFSEEIAEALKQNTPRPIVLLLFQHISVPDIFCQNVCKWAKDGFLLSVGHSCNEVDDLGCSGASQCNSAMICPGVALGVLASGAREILPEFFDVAAEALSAMMNPDEIKAGKLTPDIPQIQEAALHVACAVALCAVKMGVSRPCAFSDFTHNNDESRLVRLIERMRWQPEYLPLTVM